MASAGTTSSSAPSPTPGTALGRVHVQLEQVGRGRRREGVHRGAQRAQRREQLRRGRLVAEVGHLDDDERLPAQRLGDVLERREVQDAPDRGGLVGHRAHPLAPGAQDLGGALDGEGEHPGVELVDRVELELDGGDDAEVAAAAAHGPEEVGLVVGVGDDARARRR